MHSVTDSDGQVHGQTDDSVMAIADHTESRHIRYVSNSDSIYTWPTQPSIPTR